MKLPTKSLTLCLLLWAGCFTAVAIPTAQAQADTPAAEAQNTSFFDLIKQGGWAMWPLGLFSMASVALIVYNGIMIQPKRFLQPETTAEINAAMQELDFERANRICSDNPGPITNIVCAGLSRIADDHIEMPQVEKAIEESSAAELSGPFVLINYLSVIGAVAPMVGLLGTVSGMVKAFRAISAGGLGDPGVLANNISEALVTTASGLTVAIPSLIAFYFFKNKYGKIAAQVGKQVGDLFFNMMVAVRKAI